MRLGALDSERPRSRIWSQREKTHLRQKLRATGDDVAGMGFIVYVLVDAGRSRELRVPWAKFHERDGRDQIAAALRKFRKKVSALKR